MLLKIVIPVLLSCFFSIPAWACTVCFGDPKSNQTKALIGGILFLLGVIGTVLGGLIVTILRIRKRSKIYQDVPHEA